jgi:ADP-heptose:LPS heptosyltransferase
MKGIGDLVLALPAIENLRRHRPGASLHAVVRSPAAADLAARLYPLDRIHLWSFDLLREPRGGAALSAALRTHGFDLVIDFMCDHSTASAAFSFSIGAPVTAGFACARRKVFFNQLVVPDHTSHIVEDWVALASSLSAPEKVTEPSVRLRSEETEFARAFLAREGIEGGDPLICVHPGARDDLARLDKRWRPERYRDLCHLLAAKAGAHFLILGTGEERELGQQVASGVALRAANACGRTSAVDLLGLIGACDLFIGNNSGPLHMANALEVPTVSFAGGVDLVRWAPYGHAERNRIMVPEPECRDSDCTTCATRGRECLDAVGVEEVSEAVLSLLNQGLRRRRDLPIPGKSGIRAH